MSVRKPAIVLHFRRRADHDLGARVRIAAERFPTPTYEWAAAFSDSHQASIQYPG